jgi:hypothetical protein
MQAGADIDSICNKCGDSPHVVLAMVGGRIAKVQCLRCGGRHRQKSPGGEPATTAKRAGGAAGKRKAKDTGPSVEANLKRPIEEYLPSSSYAIGDRIRHLVFGEGVVEKIAGRTKIQVYFPAGQKILVHGKASP